MTVAVTMVVALACGCADAGPAAPAGAAQSTNIDTNTPQGLRAKQVMDMLNSDWPIGPVGVRTLAAADKVDDVGTKMDKIWWDRPFTLTGVDIGAGQATLHVLTSYAVAQDIELRTNDVGLVDRFDVSLQPPVIKSWKDIDTELTKSGARYSYQVSKVSQTAGRQVCPGRRHQHRSVAPACVDLQTVCAACGCGRRQARHGQLGRSPHDHQGSQGGRRSRPRRTPGPARRCRCKTAAQQMISASDNMATDLLIARLGPGAVERALVAAGHHDPASMTPFPTTHELFSVGWGKPDLREQWKQASPQAREQLLKQTNSRPYEPDPERTHTPASGFGAEWYGTAGDICRVHAALQAAAVGEAVPVKKILSAIPGIDLDPAKWSYIGAKGGNLPGDLTFSWYAVDHTGQPWVVSFQLNWPSYRSPTAAGWLLSIVHQTFDLVPMA